APKMGILKNTIWPIKTAIGFVILLIASSIPACAEDMNSSDNMIGRIKRCIDKLPFFSFAPVMTRKGITVQL
ncbi:MAG: hypothetical protein ACPH8B_08660, partial [Candidatus Puniceispirillum sp.]